MKNNFIVHMLDIIFSLLYKKINLTQLDRRFRGCSATKTKICAISDFCDLSLDDFFPSSSQQSIGKIAT